jgi:hypothetical protein
MLLVVLQVDFLNNSASTTNSYILPGIVQAFAPYVSGTYLMLTGGAVYSFTTSLSPVRLGNL